jgi:enamine deaminase RidA (YjgF/YER057c/UK114 family)
MAIRRHNPGTLASPTGYSHVVRAGNTIYVAGQVARDRHGSLVGPGDARAQAEQVFWNLQAALSSEGASLQDIVKLNTYVVGAQHVDAVREARAKHLTGDLPASTLVVVAALARPEFLVEIEAIAVVE